MPPDVAAIQHSSRVFEDVVEPAVQHEPLAVMHTLTDQLHVYLSLRFRERLHRILQRLERRDRRMPLELDQCVRDPTAWTSHASESSPADHASEELKFVIQRFHTATSFFLAHFLSTSQLNDQR
jgi:hypothetical protein